MKNYNEITDQMLLMLEIVVLVHSEDIIVYIKLLNFIPQFKRSLKIDLKIGTSTTFDM